VRLALAEELKNLDYIADAYTLEDMNNKSQRPFIETFRRSYIPKLSPDIMYRINENTLVHGKIGSGHGTPYDYDTHVPVIFNAPGLEHAIYDRRISTVDIAPTIAAMLGVKADKKVDGKVLTEILEAQKN
jgi:predicted AlkP superfamily pyrophosphatase or phosphodiesterase